ncbi:MAG: putative Ig domain-containing protein, partial [Pirellulales bacterium]
SAPGVTESLSFGVVGNLPGWLTLTDYGNGTATLSGTPGQTDLGLVPVDLEVRDLAGATATQSFTIDTTNPNDAPSFQSTAVTSATEDALYTYSIVTTDPDPGDPLMITAVPTLPSWLNLTDNGNGTATLTGTPRNKDIGGNPVTLRVTDAQGLPTDQLFTITVANTNDPPTLAGAISDSFATEDAPYNFSFAAGTFDDIDVGDVLSYTAALDDGSPLPTWLGFDSGTRTFSGTPANGDVGVIRIRVTATDIGGASASDQFDISVQNTNDPPTVANPLADQTATEGSPFSFAFAADAFADVDVDVDVGDTLSYAATLVGGGSLPGWLSFDGPTRTFSGLPANDDVGVIQVDVTATDAGAESASSRFDLTVVNTNDPPALAAPIADQNATEDTVFQFTLTGVFEDEDVGDNLSYTATRADDSSLPAWLLFFGSPGIFVGVPTNDDVGTLSVRVTATDTGSASVSDLFDITVANTNDDPRFDSTPSTGVTEDAPYTYLVVASDPDIGDSVSLTAPILPGWLILTDHGDGTATLAGVPQSEHVGSSAVILRATDQAGSFDVQSFTITVTGLPAGLVGDMDIDGDVDFDDIGAFVMGLSDPSGYTSLFGVPAELYGDTDQDGDIDFDDIDSFIDLLIGGLLGEENRDGVATYAPAAAVAGSPQAVDAVLANPFQAEELTAIWRDDQDWLDSFRWS